MAKREEEERISQDIGARSAASAGRNTHDDRYMSEKDYAKISKYGDDYNAAKEAEDEEGMALAHAAAEGLRAKYSYSGGVDGSQYLYTGGGYSSGSTPSYSSKYQRQIDQLTRELLGREAFSYDPENDPTYQQYRDSYTRNGQRAMEDTLGQVSTRTGGLASSYATTASQQTYDNYMAALADKIPELRQLAYSMYRDEGADQRANLDMLMALEQGDYGKYQDLLSQYNNDRSFDYNAWRDQIADGRYDKEWNYGVGRDQVADQRYGSESEYSRALQKAETLAAAGDFSGYRALGYSDREIQAMGDAYARDQAAARLGIGGTKSTGGAYGSGGDSADTAEGDYDGLFAAASRSTSPQNYIASHYKEYGFTSSSGLSGAYENWTGAGGTTPSLDYDEDEGIFTVNGQRYSDVNELSEALAGMRLTQAQKDVLRRKFALFGFDVDFG